METISHTKEKPKEGVAGVSGKIAQSIQNNSITSEGKNQQRKNSFLY